MKYNSLLLHGIISLIIAACAIYAYDQLFVNDIKLIDRSEASITEVSRKDYSDYRLTAMLSAASPDDFIYAAEKAVTSVAYVIAYEKVGGNLFSDGYRREKGSGVIISEDGYIVTNEHVIKDADYIEIRLDDKREFIAEIIGADASTDLALLKIESNHLPFLVFADSDSLHVGEWILAVGNPFGLQSTVTAGIVSAKARNIDVLNKNDIESFIQSDAVINPGSSGGALVSMNGLLMGICTAIISSSGSYEGLSFAIPSNLARKVIIDLKQFGSVQRGKLGITIADVDAQFAEDNHLPSITGVKIVSINLNSAAALKGLMKNDIIFRIDGGDIFSTSSFYEQINKYRPGDQISIDYYRNGKPRSSKIVLRNHLNTTDYISVRTDKILHDIGIEIRDLNSIEKERMNTEGVMIISIAKGSTIEKTNMEPGFIVESFDGRKIKSAHEFIQLLKNADGKVNLKGFYERYPGRFPYIFDLDKTDRE